MLHSNTDARCDTEIKNRIALSKDSFTKSKSIFTNRNIRIYTKINTLKVYIWSILLHESNFWTLTKDLGKRFEAAANVVHQKNNENIMD